MTASYARRIRRRDAWRTWLERQRQSRIIDAIVIGAFLAALAVTLGGCTPRAIVRPAAPPVDVPACELSAPPPIVGYPSSCAPHVCLGDVDSHALAAEVDALDSWARRAYAACPHLPATDGPVPQGSTPKL